MALKDYQTVDDRLHDWWAHHPHGRVTTTVTPLDDGRWLCRAEVWRHETDLRPAATGHALADPAQARSGSAQATSPVEDGETSAVGRALAQAGWSPRGLRPSAEEMDAAGARAEDAAERDRIVTELHDLLGTVDTDVARQVHDGLVAWRGDRWATRLTAAEAAQALARARELATGDGESEENAG